MSKEFTVKISLTEHKHDNAEKPYYWSIMRYDEDWHQIAFGWEGSPNDCLSAALNQYNDMIASLEKNWRNCDDKK